MMYKNLREKNTEDRISDMTISGINTTINLKINEVKSKIFNITNLATTTDLTAFENKMPNVSNLVKKAD